LIKFFLVSGGFVLVAYYYSLTNRSPKT